MYYNVGDNSALSDERCDYVYCGFREYCKHVHCSNSKVQISTFSLVFRLSYSFSISSTTLTCGISLWEMIIFYTAMKWISRFEIIRHSHTNLNFIGNCAYVYVGFSFIFSMYQIISVGHSCLVNIFHSIQGIILD